MNGIISLILIAINVFVSYKGFKDHAFFARYAFGVDKVLVHKDYKVLLTSGFLHVNWMHLLFNMFSLFVFSESLEAYLGPGRYLFIYFASLLGGNLFSLLVHRLHSEYTSVGASGAVSGLIFASIVLFPGMKIGFIIIPPIIPSWLYGILFIAYSIYGIRSRKDNVGHEAHLAGALVGMLVAVVMFPGLARENILAILLIMIPAIVFILFILKKPGALQVDNHFFKKRQIRTLDDRYNIAKNERQKELDRILEKIHRKGMNSLTKKEKDFLKESTR